MKTFQRGKRENTCPPETNAGEGTYGCGVEPEKEANQETREREDAGWLREGGSLNVSVLDDSSPIPNSPKSALSFLTQKPLQLRVALHFQHTKGICKSISPSLRDD